ncbi:MAG: ribonuclease III [Clostridiales bacterium]|jgi:ribonuclease-3 family protein|nr:ribonuclease III [Clostridiales bacterium]
MTRNTTQDLAYLGDAVFELCAREMLVKDGSRPVRELNRMAKQYVSAAAQSKMYRAVSGALTEEERAVMKRGRNLNPATRAKNAGMSDYRHATGLEVLFGYLYCEGRKERITEIFSLCAAAVQSPRLTVKETEHGTAGTS